MTFAELKTYCLEHLGDPTGAYFTPVKVGLFINEAYTDVVVDEIDGAGGAWDIERTPITVNVVAGTRETLLTINDAPARIRKPVEVNRLDTNQRSKVHIIEYGQRNEFVRSVPTLYPRLQNVYFYRTSGGDWYIGTNEQEPEAQTLEVTYSALPTVLSADGHVPMIVPEPFHGIIAIRAAILLKMTEKRDAAELTGLYQERAIRLRKYLNAPHGAGRPMRF